MSEEKGSSDIFVAHAQYSQSACFPLANNDLFRYSNAVLHIQLYALK